MQVVVSVLFFQSEILSHSVSSCVSGNVQMLVVYRIIPLWIGAVCEKGCN